MIICAEPFTTPRLRVRRVYEDWFVKCVAEQAAKDDDWVIDVTHGGSVCNSYKYPASTECVLAISDPFGNVLWWAGRAPANKVTQRSAAMACFPHAAVLFDGRVTSEIILEGARLVLQAEHDRAFPAMQTIAVAASA